MEDICGSEREAPPPEPGFADSGGKLVYESHSGPRFEPASQFLFLRVPMGLS